MKNVIAFLLYLVAFPSFGEYKAIYTQPRGSAEIGVATQLRDSQTLEKITAVINKVVNVERDIPIVGASCGKSNAFYNREKKAVVLCYEFLTDNANKLVKKYGRQFSQQQISSVLASELVFTLLHEVGHSLFDIYELPVLGGEEDAADQFASFVLLSTNGNRQLKEATLFFHLNKPDILTRVFKSNELYGDEHSLSQQRIANLVCWGFGKDQYEFNELAVSVRLPQNRLARCGDEYSKLNRDIRNLLGSNLRINSVGNVASRPQSNPVRAIQSTTSNEYMVEMATYHKCLTCHGMEDSVNAPSFHDIARRYRTSDSIDDLVERVKLGSVGVWGPILAPAMTSVPDFEIRELVLWIVKM